MEAQLVANYKSAEAMLHHMGFMVQVRHGGFQIMGQTPTIGGGIDYHKVHACKTVNELRTWAIKLKEKRENM